jgi:phage host-nuclease inhibitor protein Gam
MAATRRKAPKQEAPQTIGEATGLIGRYAEIITATEQLRADADASIAAIEATRDAAVAPLEQEAKTIFLQLRAWWGVAAPELTDGKRKSVELAGCLVGERTTPPSLKMPGSAEAAAAALVGAGWAELTRIKVTVDKPAVLKALGHDAMAAPIAALGFSAIQKEEFFIDRAAPKPATVEEVREAAE